MAIHTERRWLRRLGLAAFALLTLHANAGEMEIYVTTGPDGIEAFSNLPRGPAGNSGIPALVVTSGANGVGSAIHVQPSWQVAEGSVDTTQGNEIAAGKSFMSDD